MKNVKNYKKLMTNKVLKLIKNTYYTANFNAWIIFIFLNQSFLKGKK